MQSRKMEGLTVRMVLGHQHLLWARVLGCFLIFVSMLVLVTEQGFSEALAVGIVNMQKVVQEIPAGKKAKEELDKEFQKRKSALDKKRDDIQKMGKDLESKRALLSQETFQKKEAEIQERMMQFQKEVGDNQLEMQKKEEELVKPIIEKIRQLVSEISEEKKLQLVLEDKGIVLFADKGIDLTEELIKRLAKFEAVSGSKKGKK